MKRITKALQIPKIDVHCHIELLPGGRRRSEYRGHDWRPSADLLVECSDTLGITECWCSSPISAGRMAPIEEVRVENDMILAGMARHPDRIRGLCFVIPGPDAVAEIERCLDAGMIGIKLYNQYRINDPIVRPIIELAVERQVPILEHAGAPNAEHKGGQPLISHGVHFAEVNERYPDAIIYHAHMGGGGDWEYTIRALRDCSPNLYIDVSGSVLDHDQVGFAVNELGAKQVLFGSDGTMAGSVGKVIDAEITEEERKLIWWDNAARILAAQDLSPTASQSETSESSQGVGSGEGTKHHSPPDLEDPAVGGSNELIDLNAWLGSYPFRSVTSDADTLLTRMDRSGITSAAVSSIEALYHRNVAPANDRLFDAVSGHERLIPLGTVNPNYPKWEQDLDRCVSQGARGIRISPQTHNYALTGPVGRDLVAAISSSGLPVFIPHRIEDPRQRQWMDPGTTTGSGEIAEIVSRFPETTVVVNNARGIYKSPLWQRPDIRDASWYLDLSLAEIHFGLHWGIESAKDLGHVVAEGGASHFVFGTHQPFSYVAPAQVKLMTLGVEDELFARISAGNAKEILGIED
jgi:uncharacterized protein